MSVTVIGFGSNLLVRDGGIDGVVVVLGEAFTNVAFDGTTVTAGAAALDVNVARAPATMALRASNSYPEYPARLVALYA